MSGPTMRAVAFRGAGDFAFEDVPVPVPGAGEVLVRIDRIGVCGTDVHLFDGSLGYVARGLTRYPLRPGHEWSGVAVSVPGAQTRVRVGDRVVGEPFLSCGRCVLCRRGRRDQCAQRAELGVRGAAPGAAAEFLAVAAENVAVVPPELPATTAVLAEPLVTVLHALAATGWEPGESVGVIGAGTLGLLAAQVVRAGGSPVTIYARGDRSVRADGVGARFVPVERATPDVHDVVLEVSGGRGAVNLALRTAAPTGRLALVGMAAEVEPIDTTTMITKGLEVTGVLGGIPFLARAVALLAEGVVRAEPVVDRVLPFARYREALELVTAGTTSLPKIVLALDDTTPRSPEE